MFEERASFEGVNFKGANLQETDLQGANLQGANLQGANLQETDLQGANLRKVKNLTLEQLEIAVNWKEAYYEPEVRECLGLGRQ